MSKLFSLRHLLLFFVFITLSLNSWAQSIWTNAITGTNPNTASPYTSGQTIDANLTVSGIGRGAGIAGTNTNDRYNATGWNNAGIDANDYFEFTLTPHNGYWIDFNSLVYTAQASGTGPASFAFRSSIDNYSADIGTPASTGSTMNLSAGSYQSITSAITFRFYGWGGSGGTFSINDFTFNGTVTTPPKYYRTITSGDWNNIATWESSPDNIVWSAAVTTPSASDNTIIIQNLHTLNVTTFISLDETSIEGALAVQTGGMLNINDGMGDDIDILNGGIFTVVSTASYTTTINYISSSNFNIANGGKITIGNGGIVGANYIGFASSSNNIWNDGSVFEWNSTNDFGLNSITFFPGVSSATIPIFRVTKSAGTSGGSSSALINGILEINSNLALSGNGLKIFRDGITGSGLLTLNSSSGGYTISSSTAIISGAVSIILNEDLRIAQGVAIPTGADINISGTASINKASGNFLIDGTINLNTLNISNTSGNVTVNGTLKTSNVNGFSNTGATIVSGTIILNTGSTIEYNAFGNQVVNSRNDYKNIKFSGSGIKTISSGFNPAGNVIITGSAIVVAGSFTFGNVGTNLIMDGGRLKISGATSAKPDIDGTYSLTGGVIEFYNTGSAGLQTIKGVNVGMMPIEYNQIEITGDKVGNSNANITLRNGGVLTIKTGGVFEINADAIIGPTGVQTVIVENGATFKCGDADGFSGYGNPNPTSIRNDIETIALNAGSKVEYSRAGIQVITNTGSYSNLLISGTGIKTAQSGILTVNGNLSKSGNSTFSHNGGTVLLNGLNQSFAGLTYNNLVLSNGTKTTSGNCTINDSIKISTSTILSIASNDSIFLHSDATKTARVGQVEGTITYGSNSKFVVERYIPGHRAWRLLTAPVSNTSQTINQAWQEGTVNPDLIYTNNLNPKPGYGTHITGINRTTDPTYGFDPGPQNNSSLKYYNNGWMSLPSGTGTNNSSINSQPAFMLFVRGDRSVDLINHVYNPIPIATVLRVSGQINTGTQPVINIAPNTFKLIANPYASSIDMRKINKTGFSEFYLWDANLGSVGAYTTFSLNVDGDYEATPIGGSYPGGINNFIQSGQGFFVNTSAASSGTVIIEESAKEISGTSSVFQPITAKPVAQLRTNIYAVNPTDTILMDGVLINFENEASNDVDEFDAIKLSNFSSSIGMSRNDKILVIERRKPVNSADTISYHTTQLGQKNYQLEFIAKNLANPRLQAFVEDKFLGSQTEVDLNAATRINFSITTATSAAADRFRLVFKYYVSPALKTITTVKAVQQHQDISVKWTVLNEKNIEQYHVEKSTRDGYAFAMLTKVTATNNNNDTVNYQWTDLSPVSGANYYRIKTISLSGNIQYSNTVKIIMPVGKAEMAIFPNPVVEGIINLRFINQPKGNYLVRLLNNTGQVIVTRQIQHNENNRIVQIKMNNTLSIGNYLLEVTGRDSTKTTFNVSK